MVSVVLQDKKGHQYSLNHDHSKLSPVWFPPNLTIPHFRILRIPTLKKKHGDNYSFLFFFYCCAWGTIINFWRKFYGLISQKLFWKKIIEVFLCVCFNVAMKETCKPLITIHLQGVGMGAYPGPLGFADSILFLHCSCSEEMPAGTALVCGQSPHCLHWPLKSVPWLSSLCLSIFLVGGTYTSTLLTLGAG
jgi:hypothetical protein